MADIDEVLARINSELTRRKKKIVNGNAIGALIGALGGAIDGNPGRVIEALGAIFFGRKAALSAGRQEIAQEAMLELLCKIDEAITNANDLISATGNEITLEGLVEVTARDGDNVVGVSLGERPVVFKPGFRIITDTHNVKNTTGLKIG